MNTENLNPSRKNFTEEQRIIAEHLDDMLSQIFESLITGVILQSTDATVNTKSFLEDPSQCFGTWVVGGKMQCPDMPFTVVIAFGKNNADAVGDFMRQHLKAKARADANAKIN